MNIGRKRQIETAAIAVGPLLAILIQTLLVARARGVPDIDYWEMFSTLVADSSISLSLQGLLQTSNEHIVIVTKLFYLLNYYLFDGDNFGLSVITILFSALIIFCLIVVFSQWENFSILDRLLVGLIVSVFIFTPFASHNFFLGMSGIAWIGANASMLVAATLMLFGQLRSSLYLYVLAIGFAFISAQFYSTGLAAMCAIGVQCLFVRKTRELGLALILTGLAMIYVVYLLQEIPPSHAPRSFDPLQLLIFCLTFIGAGLTATKQPALVLGAIGLLAFSILAMRRAASERKADPVAAFFIGIAFYSLLNAGLGSITRSSMGGQDIALSSRYATLPALFWLSLFGLTLRDPFFRAERLRTRAVMFLGFFLAGTVLVTGSARVNELLWRSAGKPLATLSLSRGILDEELIQRSVSLTPQQYTAIRDALASIGHVPFNGRDFGCPALGTTLSFRPSGQSLIGYIDGLRLLRDQPWYRITGWAAATTTGSHYPPLARNGILGLYDCLGIVASDGTVIGFALGGEARPDVGEYLGSNRHDFGWTGYASPALSKQTVPFDIFAVVKEPGTQNWVRLPVSISIGQ